MGLQNKGGMSLYKPAKLKTKNDAKSMQFMGKFSFLIQDDILCQKSKLFSAIILIRVDFSLLNLLH
jgi:hypothetical protein